jgi:multimeric flavodoxin WrbA
MKSVIIQGSSRSGGNTSRIIEVFRKSHQSDIIDLSQLNIGFYDYEHQNNDDDFLPTMKNIVEYDLIIFATPVYWYAMSGSMKTFFDRITECLKTEKDTGRKLRGKSMAAISCGSDDNETDGFFVPFRETAGYLGMNYLGDVHTWIEDSIADDEVVEKVNKFALNINSVLNVSTKA